MDARKALSRLRDGNRRFASANSERTDHRPRTDAGPPVAIVLGCSDSRVPPEIVFDQGVGDLFVVRVAGNVAGPAEVGSIEFAVTALGARLVVVLGHTRCAAVWATLERIARPGPEASPQVRAVLDLIQPAVEPLWTGHGGDPTGDDGFAGPAVRANVRASMVRLNESEALASAVRGRGLGIVGAEYSVETGKVEFFDFPGGWN